MAAQAGSGRVGIDMRAVVTAHSFMVTECPPEPWAAGADEESFFRLLGEMIAAGLARNGGRLGELTLNVANVTVEPEAAGRFPAGDFIAVTVRGRGDWGPEVFWSPESAAAGAAPLVTRDLQAAAVSAQVACGYSRVLSGGEGSVTVFVRRA